MEKERFIYALVDPREPGIIRYVGCSERPWHRCQDHLSDSRRKPRFGNAAKIAWLSGLLDAGVLPWIVILERVKPGQNWVRREEYWIVCYRTPELTNFARLIAPDDGFRAGTGSGT